MSILALEWRFNMLETPIKGTDVVCAYDLCTQHLGELLRSSTNK